MRPLGWCKVYGTTNPQMLSQFTWELSGLFTTWRKSPRSLITTARCVFIWLELLMYCYLFTDHQIVVLWRRHWMWNSFRPRVRIWRVQLVFVGYSIGKTDFNCLYYPIYDRVFFKTCDRTLDLCRRFTTQTRRMALTSPDSIPAKGTTSTQWTHKFENKDDRLTDTLLVLSSGLCHWARISSYWPQ